MIMKPLTKVSQFCLLLVTSIALSACTLTTLTDRQQICNKLQRQYVYEENNRNIDATWVTPTQKQHQRDLIKQYNCTP